jgi:hypothetical protein
MEQYIFNSKEVYIQSLVHLINIYFDKDVIGAEIGTGTATSTCTLVQNCSNIKTIYAIDQYSPYANFIKEPYDGTPLISFDKKEIEYVKLTAVHNIKYSGNENKIKLIHASSLDASKNISGESLDFLFLDAHSTTEQVKEDLDAWYPKVKPGGIISGHDWISSVVQEKVNKFREFNKITNKLSTFDNIWVWKK